jgi:hypothetical protein
MNDKEFVFQKVQTCSICKGDIEQQRNEEGVVYWAAGHNAAPVNDGRCCDTCNAEIVIPARLFIYERTRARKNLKAEVIENSETGQRTVTIKEEGGQDETDN